MKILRGHVPNPLHKERARRRQATFVKILGGHAPNPLHKERVRRHQVTFVKILGGYAPNPLHRQSLSHPRGIVGRAMRELDRKLRGKFVVSRTDVLDAGGSDDSIKMRVGNGWWSALHPGVYRVGPPSGEWMERLRAAVLAAGPNALVSHRSAFVLWGLDGINAQLVELTVPYAQAPVPGGVIRHRTRRIMPRAMLHGLPVMGLERTLLDVAPLVPVAVLAKGVDSALRLALTDPTAISKTVSEQGGPGVRGVRRLERVLSALENTGPTGSPAELDLLMGMRREGIPMPTLQWEITTRSGQRYRVDFGWPGLGKVVEVDGLDAHSGPDNLDRDLVRQNALLDMGLQIRRYTARSIRHNLDGVVSSIAEFLAS